MQLRTKIHAEEKTHKTDKKMDQNLYPLYLEAFSETKEVPSIHHVSRFNTNISMVPTPYLLQSKWIVAHVHYAWGHLFIKPRNVISCTEELHYPVLYCALFYQSVGKLFISWNQHKTTLLVNKTTYISILITNTL